MSSTTNGLTNINFMSQSRYEGLSTYENDELYAVEATSSTITPTMPLLTPIWEDHIVNDTSYLRADTFSWQSGNIYTAAYNHLAEDLSGDNEYVKQHKPILAIENNCLVVKTGTVVCVPNGFESDGVTKKYNLVTYTTDFIVPNDQTTTISYMLFSNGTSDKARTTTAHCIISTTEPTSPEEYDIWYDTTNNVIKRYISSAWTTGSGYSLPICYGIWGNTTFEKIRQTYSGVNWFEEKSETIGSYTIAYYQGEDGHKLCLSSQENILMNIYDEVGVAWYYIVDTTNERFKLPRTKYAFTGLRDKAGNYVPESLPNITGTLHSYWGNFQPNLFAGAFTNGSSKVSAAANGSNSGADIAYFDASGSSSTYQDGAPVQQRSIQMYLYFFVGNYVKNEQSIDVGTITESLNDKQDVLTGASGVGDYVLEYKLATADDPTWYRVYKSGWVEQGSHLEATTTTSVVFLRAMADTNYSISRTIIVNSYTGNLGCGGLKLQSKTTTGFSIYADSNLNDTYWEVKGMGA